MAITKINTPELFDLGTTNSSFRLPSGDTASRPSNPNTGEWRYNTDDNYVEYWDGSAWFQIDYEAVAPTCTTNTINYPSGTTNTAYYKMSDATDSTLNGYNGTATDVDFNVQGKFGNAGEFNGSSSYITTPIGTAPSGGNSRTFSLWVNTTNTSSNQTLIHYGNANPPNRDFFVWRLNGSSSSTIEFSDYVYTYFESAPSVFDGNWHHLAFVYNGSTIQYYVDGSALGSGSSVSLTTANTIMGIGDYNSGAGVVLDGKLDQVRIFNTALTSDQVTDLYDEVQCVPAIVPSEHFNTVLYTGNFSTNSITGVGFQPDLVWAKLRGFPNSHLIFDLIRGVGNYLAPDATVAETFYAPTLTSFDSDGFTLGADNTINKFGTTAVAWNWKAGGYANTFNVLENGTVTSSSTASGAGITAGSDTVGSGLDVWEVSANRDSGFSIVNYKNTSGDGAVNVGHGLSQAPDMIIQKSTNSGVIPWVIYHKDVGTGKYLSFTTGTPSTAANVMSLVDSTSFSSYWSNTAYEFINYCFHSVDGFSDIGSYVGTNAPGNSIVTGFRPAYLMIKLTSAANGNWIIFDNKRNTSNPLTDVLKADDAGVETTEAALNIDFLSNGFTLNGAAGAGGTGQINSIGETYIYLAIAEQVYNANAVTANQTNPFNDGSQIAQYEFEDNADDSQPNGYIGKGGTFNGSSSYIDTTYTVPAVSTQSISVWFKTTSTGVNQIIYADSPANGAAVNTRLSLMIQSNNNFRLLNGNNSSYWLDSTISALSYLDGNWHNAVVTYSGTTFKLYVDGSLLNTYTSTISFGTAGNQSLVLGKAGLNNVNYFSGSIDQVRIYNTALNPNDVWLLYSETSATSSTLDYPASTGAIALYELEGDATSTSSSTYDGAATDVAWVPLYDGTPTSMQYSAPSVSTPFLKAAVFNGSSSYIETSNLIGTNLQFSASFWVNGTDMNKNSSDPNLIETLFYNRNPYILIYQYNGNWSYTIKNSSSQNTSINYATSNFNNNQWYHLVITCSGLGGQMNLYIDGTNVGTNTAPTSTRNVASTGFIGAGGATSQFFDGKIDQVRIFNKALDAGEVTQLYNEPNN